MSEAQTQTQAVESGTPDSPLNSAANQSELPSYETHKLEPQGAPAPPPPSHAPPPAIAGPPMARGTPNATAAPRTETSRCLETSKGKKWLQLFVKSRATSHSAAPVFFEGDIIAGRVELDLDKAEGYKGVTICIQAGTTFVGQEEEVFLKQEHSLWTPSGKESKLSGKHTWPFEFTLPTEVDVKDGELGKKSTYRLPPSFTERASPAYIDYKIIITLKRGFLRVNQTLVTNVAYQPLTFPDPPSHLRRLAYSDGSLLIGPSGDPDGWKVLPPVQVKGTLFNIKEVEVTCTLAIATPLCYAPGSPIPLHATFTCEDTHALDVLAEPSAFQLLLRRSLATGLEATDDKAVRRTDNHFYENSAVAYFWQSWEEDSHTPYKRVFQGEVEVTKTLKPSFKFPNFCVRYSLDLFPFKAAGFSPAGGIMPIEGKYPLFLSVPVEITTRQTPGVIPHSYAPPGYEKPQIVDYNKSLGVLENGNQRFLGHAHGHGH